MNVDGFVDSFKPTTTSAVITCSGPHWQAEWDAFIENSTCSSLSHLACWQRIVTQAYGHPTFYLMYRRESEISGVLPLVWLPGGLFASALCSMPFLDYAGICAADETSGKALLAKAIELRDSCKAQYLELRHQNPSEYGGIRRQDKVDMVLDLSPGKELIWNSLPPKVRNQVRKATKSGLSAQIGGAEYLEHFYRVFAVNMRELGSPVHSPKFFAQILQEFNKNAKIILACEGSKIVGALLCLFFKDSAFVPWASSIREYFSKCPNNLLYWEAIQFACENGCKFFHFGRSSIGSGTHKFKQQWGAQSRQLNWDFFSRNRSRLPIPTAENSRLQLAAKIWKQLPLSWTMLLGPHLRKHMTN